MEKKPNVFPTQNKEKLTPSQLEAKKKEVMKEVYTNALDTTKADAKADPNYANAIDLMKARNEEQMKLRDAALEKNRQATAHYNDSFNEIAKVVYTPAPAEFVETQIQETYTPPKTVSEPTAPIAHKDADKAIRAERYIQDLSSPEFNAPHDILPLPSEGKVYAHKKSSIRVAFLTALDESILTSPNLLQSGRFLEVLMNRKILESNVRYEDLNVGDRNAIMIWLRATSYGYDYPVVVLDENNKPFNTIVKLNELKTKKLGAEPDANGFFDYTFKLCKASIKFKLLTVRDMDELEEMNNEEPDDDFFLNKSNIYTLQKQIVSVNGDSNKDAVNQFINFLRVGDVSDFRAYVEEIESGIDLNIEVGTPGGGSIKTFLPLNTNFFWPNLRV